MEYDFDAVIDRKNTNSVKFDFPTRFNKPENVMPLWIADMDFKAPPSVLEALAEVTSHGIFGYSDTGTRYFDVLQNWFLRHFDWQIEPEWLVKVSGVVIAIHIGIRALTNEGDAIIIQQPVYHPFATAVETTKRKLVVNELVLHEGRYLIDFDDFEKKIVNNNVKMFILCSPHNPVGRVWTMEELMRLGDICLRHGVYVISDEIHADIVYPGHTHHVFANLNPELLDITITSTAPSKTFNVAGLQLSNNFIANPKMRKAFIQEYRASGLSQLNTMGIVASEAAYKEGEQWLEDLITYLDGNVDFLRDYLAKKIPLVSLIEPEGTYLAWLDFKKLGLCPEELNDFIVHKGGLWLNDGPTFGAGGKGFQRMNIGCPRKTLEEALGRLEKAINLEYN